MPKTPIKILFGPLAGHVGFISGTLAERTFGVTHAMVYLTQFAPNDYRRVALSNMRELTQAELMLLQPEQVK